MNVIDAVGFEGILSTKDTSEEKMGSLVSRLELFRMSLIDQLRKEPTVFFADPVNQSDLVKGAKPGDVSVWQDEAGVQHFKILGLE